MSELASGPAIQSGRAEGLLEFIDFVIKSGYGTESAWTARKSAVRGVFQTVEGSDDYLDFDVRGIDLPSYVERYETKARGSMKAESVVSYRQRFVSAVDAYREFLDTGQPPRSSSRRPARGDNGDAPTPRKGARTAELTTGRREVEQPSAAAGERLLEYPFPLRSGSIALLRLPVHLDKTDAERLAAFVRTLVLEPQRELTAGDGGPTE